MKIIKSPLLTWSRNNAYLTFRYTMTKPFTATARKTVTCYRDLGGKYLQRRWYSTITLKAREESKECLRTVDPYRYPYLCKTFRVVLVVGSTKSGVLGIDHVDFGGYEVCRNYPVRRRTSKCGSDDNCGLCIDSVGPGILNLPEVWHHPSNRYLIFYYEMVPVGVHILLVRAVCTAKGTNPIIPLGPFHLEFEIPNADIDDNTSGWICMDIHHYVDEETCPAFTISVIAYAAYTPLCVNNIHFSDQLHPQCGKF